MDDDFKKLIRETLDQAESDAKVVDGEFHCTDAEFARTAEQLDRLKILRKYLEID